MPKLLISVRNAEEAEIALSAGADVIDVKEPARGPLGFAGAEAIAAVVAQVAGRAPVTAALGELLQWEDRDPPVSGCGLWLVKFGLSGCGSRNDWVSTLQCVVDRGCAGARPVGVMYADWEAADAPPPEGVLEASQNIGAPAILIDTFDKSSRGLLDLWTPRALAERLAAARGAGMLTAVAGSLGAESVAALGTMSIDFLAFRGAACRGGRRGAIDAENVRRLAQEVVAAGTCQRVQRKKPHKIA